MRFYNILHKLTVNLIFPCLAPFLFILDKRINKNVLKQVIIENRNFIRKIPGEFIERECFRLPEQVKKVIIFHGVRRSGKTYLLYHLMRQNPDNSLYIDFEDESLLCLSPSIFYYGLCSFTKTSLPEKTMASFLMGFIPLSSNSVSYFFASI